MQRIAPAGWWILAAASGILTSCGMLGLSDSPKDERSYLVQLVVPFPVYDVRGKPYDQPFLGGVNVPRPQFVDIDDDGDPDLFRQEHPGRVSFHENVGTPAEARFEWRSDQYGGLEVGDWYRFVDIDGDGDADLLTERRYSRVRYYRNDGSASSPLFVIAEDTLRDVTGEPVFSDRQNNPNVADIDCDGLHDLFIGRLDGSVTRYELDHLDDMGIPRFRFVEDRFQGISIIAQFGSMHGANGLALFDVDSDGDLDFFWGDFFEAGLLLIENTGSCEEPNLRGEPLRFPLNDPVETSGYNVPVFADLDGDGDQDLVIGVLGGAFDPNRTSAENLYHLRNDAESGFKLVTRRFLNMIDVGTESYPVLVDLDADGDLDLVVSNKIDPLNPAASRLFVFRNTGSKVAPQFQEETRIDLGAYYHYAPAFGDLDDDGDIDMLLGTWNKGAALFWNIGSREKPEFVEHMPSFVTLTRGSNSAPELADMDDDGDLDLLVGEASGTLNYYRNDGSRSIPEFTLVSDEFEGIDVGRRSVPRLLDLDADGDLDLVVASESGETFFYRNEGTPSEHAFVLDEARTIQLPFFAVPTFGDLDGDGDLDLVSGGDGGGLVYFEMRGAGSNSTRTGAPSFIYHE
ncbi:MAG TPA: FG-GAP-like repeat-containing protein [Rhodothermia bacterium]|nr:FG-GAP-like repeat-containing protein [Rhodothermia bacterium]